MKRHADGTRCKEGMRRVPRRYRPCCDIFGGHVATCEYDVRYEWWRKDRIWVIAISESAGGGGVVIHFCPHCGKALQPKGRPHGQRPGLARRRPSR
jgi:hypothetical protein